MQAEHEQENGYILISFKIYTSIAVYSTILITVLDVIITKWNN